MAEGREHDAPFCENCLGVVFQMYVFSVKVEIQIPNDLFPERNKEAEDILRSMAELEPAIR